MCLQVILAHIVKIIILVVCCQQGGRVDNSDLFPLTPQRSTIRSFSEQLPWESSGIQLRNVNNTVGPGKQEQPHVACILSTPKPALLGAKKEPPSYKECP